MLSTVTLLRLNPIIILCFLSNLSDVYGLHQLINTPTGVKSASSTLTDVIFTNYLDRVVCSSVSHVSLSDHSLVYVFREVSIDPSILL